MIYDKGEARIFLQEVFTGERDLDNVTMGEQRRFEAAKALAIAEVIEDLEGHLAMQMFYGTNQRA